MHGVFAAYSLREGRLGAMRDQMDLRVDDRVALDEIDLYADVLSAVAVADRALTAQELDEVLGVRPERAASQR
jgi:hypothetical protein